jgi:hypothetical protein
VDPHQDLARTGLRHREVDDLRVDTEAGDHHRTHASTVADAAEWAAQSVA